MNNISGTQRLRATLHQEVQVYQLPRSDIEYKIELDLGHALRDLWLAGSRNFTNPHTLESAQEEDIPDILGIYPTTWPAQP